MKFTVLATLQFEVSDASAGAPTLHDDYAQYLIMEGVRAMLLHHYNAVVTVARMSGTIH